MPWRRKWQPTSVFFFLSFFFNWRITALQNFVAFSQTSTHELAIDIHMFSPSWISLPFPSPSHLSSWYRAPALGSLLHTQSPTGYLFYLRNVQALILKRLLWLPQSDAAAGENLAKCLTLRMCVLINWPETSWVRRCLERQGMGPRGPPYPPGQWPCWGGPCTGPSEITSMWALHLVPGLPW